MTTVLEQHMKHAPAMKLCDDGADATVGARAERLAGPKRRARVLRTASAQFALTGLHGTPALTLAKAADISEAILYVHFGDKTQTLQRGRRNQ